VTKTILVQAGQTLAETAFLLELAGNTEFVAGVIGWFDLEREDFWETFDRYRSNYPALLGQRRLRYLGLAMCNGAGSYKTRSLKDLSCP
jgi:predicted TIM-barrel fold metal-dependent hydrolase